MTTWRDVERLKDELASALEDLDREVKIGNDLMAENAKYREALYLMRLAALQDNHEVVEYHANRCITMAEDIRRECFLQTHVSGEVR